MRPTAQRSPRPLRRVLVACGVGAIASLLLLEGAFRLLLFADVPRLEHVSSRLRLPQCYFTVDETGYWTYAVHFTPPGHLVPVPGPDPRVGWRGYGLKPGTYEHPDEPLIRSRRPVLLYGDSFAQCVTKSRECWQGLMRGSELGETHALVNYGVGGYGFDQIVLLMEETVDRFLDRDPIVVVGILVDEDLDRSLLAFRCWPKPRFRVEDGELIEPDPVEVDFDQGLADLTPFVWSWAWRYLTHGGWTKGRIESSPRARPAIEELSRLLLARVKAHLDARGVEWFVLLFEGTSLLHVNNQPDLWQRSFLVDTLRELEMPFVSTRRELIAYGEQPGARARDLFLLEGVGAHHYTALGNAVAFPAILRGIRGDFD